MLSAKVKSTSKCILLKIHLQKLLPWKSGSFKSKFLCAVKPHGTLIHSQLCTVLCVRNLSGTVALGHSYNPLLLNKKGARKERGKDLFED